MRPILYPYQPRRPKSTKRLHGEAGLRGIICAFAALSTLLFSLQLAAAQFAQQGPKLVGTGVVGMAIQGFSVGVSGDGNTALLGGPYDNSYMGAAWLFTRTNGAWAQQGSKLVGTGAVGNAQQGYAVALSADGSTALVGGVCDAAVSCENAGIGPSAGAAWVFTRTGSLWSQQGSKLVANDEVGAAFLGWSVALSADGNTAIIGGARDNMSTGAAWVFTRNNGIWTQQGSKLVANDVVGAAWQGYSVGLSADGNTAIVGGPYDNSNTGAAWVFTRTNDVWTQQGSKLVGAGAAGTAVQGYSVALSGDGNTAIVGGQSDNSGAGASWIFTRTGSVWSQQGSKLVSADAVSSVQAPASQGWSVALSSDGNTALVGGDGDNVNTGAVWVYTRSAGTWTQQGSKLVGGGGVGKGHQGISVGLSANGNTAIWGAESDDSGVGAAWLFVQPLSKANGTNTHDFNGDGYSDIAWHDASGDIAIWLMNSTAVSNKNSPFVANVASQWRIVGQRDFNGDGSADLLWRDTGGNVAIWEMNGTAVQNAISSYVGNVPTYWSIVGTGDFDGDGLGDILWQDTSGNVAIWLMNGTAVVNASSSFVAFVAGQWSIKGTGDFNADGKTDILWQDTSGNIAIWEMNGTEILNSNTSFVGNVPGNWSIVGTGDFNGDAMGDLLWRDTSGNVAIWEMNGTAVLNVNTSFVANVNTQWSIELTGDYNGDGFSDILWRDTSGNVAMWEMNGTTVLNPNSSLVGNVPRQWSIQHLGAE